MTGTQPSNPIQKQESKQVTNSIQRRHGFEQLRYEEVPDINSTIRPLRHHSGALLISIENDDPNKSFVGADVIKLTAPIRLGR